MTHATMAIGIGAPLSGVAAALGLEMKQAIELAVDAHNTSRENGDTRVTVVVRDDQGSPSRGEVIAREFCADPHILGVVGHYNSDVTIAAAAIYDAAGVAMITPIASNPSLTGHRWPRVFRLTNRDDSTARAIATYLYQNAAKRRAAVIESRTAYGESMAGCFVRAFTQTGGAIAGRYQVREGQRDFTELLRAFPPDIDLVFYGGSFEGAPLLRALRDAGIKHLFATGDGCWDVENFLRPAGDAATIAEGVIVLSASLPADHPGPPRDVAYRYRERFGSIGNYALNAYDAARALLTAIDHAARQSGRRPERAAVVAALPGVGLEGVAFPGRLDWDVRGDNLSAVTVLHVVRNDRFEAIATIGREQRLVVGLDDALPPPMQLGDPAGSDFRGYEVDLLHEIADRLGVELRYRRAPWSRLLDDLQRGAVDLICSAATVSDDRRRTVDFSRSYLPAALAIVTRKDRPAARLADVVTLGVRRATTAERFVRESGRDVTLVSESNDELYEALASGRLDAIVDDLPIGGAFVRKLPGLQLAALSDTDSAYALVLRKGHDHLRSRLDAILEDLEANGTLSALQDRWQVSTAA